MELPPNTPKLPPNFRKCIEQAQLKASSALQSAAQVPTRSMATSSNSPASLANHKRPAHEDEDMILSRDQASQASCKLPASENNEAILTIAPASLGGRKPPTPKNEGPVLSKSLASQASGKLPASENNGAILTIVPASLAGRKRPAPEEEDTDEDFKLWVEHQKLANQRQALREKRIQLSADKAKIEQEIAQTVADDRLLENHQEHLKTGKPAEWVLVQGIKFGTRPDST